ncbi:MAG: flagellar biosynthetic protein FliO [Planctomycetes bacterium]|nr:flagellar biosynthetic protein FliO [Planctomycetota bacterium]
MARHLGMVLLGVLMAAATAQGEPAAAVSANARLIIPAEGPTTVPAGVEQDAAPAEAAPDPQPTPPASAPARPDTESRAVQRSAKEEQAVGRTGAANDAGTLWQTLAALALVVVLIFLARRLLGRFAGGRMGNRAPGVVEVLSRTPVGSRQSVMLLRVGPRVLIVGAGGETMTTLAEIDDPQQVSQLLGAVEQARAGSLTNAFAGVLNRQRIDWPAGEEEDMGAAARQVSPLSGAVDQMKTMLGRLRNGGRAEGPR